MEKDTSNLNIGLTQLTVIVTSSNFLQTKSFFKENKFWKYSVYQKWSSYLYTNLQLKYFAWCMHQVSKNYIE